MGRKAITIDSYLDMTTELIKASSAFGRALRLQEAIQHQDWKKAEQRAARMVEVNDPSLK